MAGETTAAETEVDLGGEEKILGQGSDAALAEQFREAGEGNTIDETEEEIPQGEGSGISLASIQAQLDELKEQNTTLRVENDVYKQGLMARPREIIRETPAPAPVAEKPKSFIDTINVEEINNGLRTDPGATIAKLVKDVYSAAREDIGREVSEKATETVTGANAQQRAYNQDQAAAVGEFGDLMQNNAEFADLANRIYGQITEDGIVVDKNGNRWRPGAIYTAMATAHSQMVRQGKIKVESGEQTQTPAQSTRGSVVPLTPRKKEPVNALLGDTKNAGGGNNLLEGIDAETQQQMRRAAAGLKVPFDTYLKTFRAMQKRDPSYGRG